MRQTNKCFSFIKVFSFTLLIWICHNNYEPTNSGISCNKKLNLNNTSTLRTRRLLKGEKYEIHPQKNFHLYQKIQGNLQDQYNSLKFKDNFENSDDYLEREYGELKEPFGTKIYNSKKKNSLSKHLKKLDATYERVVERLLGIDYEESNKFSFIIGTPVSLYHFYYGYSH
ncbi:PIR Superfamily Protein [Plasmodium malariae]|uniref:PIR Superfamily Protein n=1 Tax=Plasmodium malariae TaxID=5858 RepID=A0A1A8WWT8_PLAMA|nr:PIR Superfamily Protein [Plasmodium malariae]